ncbi:type IV secretion system protein VirB8 (plasmid) [Komagataeibacter nataicola]|jgi:type IV secretion system protein VirB8|uniref:Type IV secretion system protein VirB8 n=3 Tax=Acetobacteraceae TaxID=433 RepID=A0A967BEB3_9PROT|nr:MULTISPECIES: type IV secretion system protein VirB8 [Acetobacteraceae]MBF0865874.1 type IV secretion system protein VirB8 [Gluconobacter sp. R71656]MBF0868666.1 type IV secretion system protein VirB8 [Gluconobacter sp. R75628]MBF0874648.1 type IV secretion system protein VirB8 [Gluconobacter sp. R75629]MBF0883904.1 type IV secretion system protein VirB8 [Gluconobacter potus]MBL7241266.1 type IV secretion system protein VirB8 [Komagataeibacter rhaeticus]
MTNNEFTPPVPNEKLAEHYEQVETFQKARVRSVVRINKFLLAGLAVSMIANMGLAWSIGALLPLEKLVPMPLWVRPDGTVDSEISMSRLPKTMDEAVINSAVWQYVRLREGYTYATAQYAYDTVSLMSSDQVRDQYQSWFNFPNPKSPQVTVGKKGQIDVEEVSLAPIGNSVIQVRFRRTVSMDGQRPQVTTWTATVQILRLTDLPAKARLNNPGGVIVTSYQSSEDGV